MKRALLLSCSLVLFGLVAACNSPQEAAVTGLAVELASIDRAADGSTTATIRILNPNVVAYNVAEAEHEIYLNGRMVGTVNIERPTGVPARSEAATQTGVLKLRSGESLPTGTIDYRMNSELILRLWGDTTQELKVSSSGSVAVR